MTCAARDFVVTTCAPGSSFWISFATASTLDALLVLTKICVTRPVLLDIFCNVDKGK